MALTCVQITFSVSALKDEYEGGKIVKTSGWCNYIKGVLIKVKKSTVYVDNLMSSDPGEKE